MLRDPVARAFSSHIHHVRMNRENEGFRRALELQDARNRLGWWFGFQLKAVGLYAESIRAYQNAFSSVKVILNDDLNKRTTETVRSTLEFLGIESSHRLEVSQRHNENRLTRSPSLKQLIRRLERLRLLSAGLARAANNLNTYRPSLDMAFAATIAPEFKSDLEKSSDLIGRDLCFWLDRYRLR